jgi:periplasmic divalent cation tolerance protein
MTNAVVGLVTCSSRAEARKIAKLILTKNLAACVNILDGLESHYWWQDKLEKTRECLLLIKTTRAKERSVIGAVQAAHGYEVPEIVFVPVAQGERNYLEWIQKSVK